MLLRSLELKDGVIINIESEAVAGKFKVLDCFTTGTPMSGVRRIYDFLKR